MTPATCVATCGRCHWIGAAAVAVTFAILMCVSWLRWADVLIDFGRELYVPWRITQGDVPYRDLAVFFGPLSMYINAFWFTIFGTSLMTLALCNAAVLALFTVFMYWMLSRIAGVWSATIGCIVFLSVFAFGHLRGMANYNFVCPYSHELVHGLMLGLAGTAMFAGFVRTGRARDAIIAGVLLGGTFLTKPEPFVATMAAVGVGWLSMFVVGRNRIPSLAKGAALMFAGTIVPPTIATVLLATAMPLEQALRGVLGSWVFMGNDELRGLPFYGFIMGTSKPGANILALGQWTAWIIAVLAPALVGAWLLPARVSYRWIRSGVVTAIAAAVLWRSGSSFAWEHTARPLPLIMLISCMVIAWNLWRDRNEGASREFDIFRLMFTSFAGALTLKMILNTAYGHYGFVLAMPATLVVIAVLVDWVPSWLDRRGRAGWLFRGWSIGVIIVFLIAMQRYNQWHASDTVVVGSGGDQFKADNIRGTVVNELLQSLRDCAPPDAAVTVMPEGAMMNYLSRRWTGTPYFNFLPPELAMFDEDRIVNALDASPPPFIALVQRDTPEYGTRVFGADYGKNLMRWVMTNYQIEREFRYTPGTGPPEFFILLLKRNTIAPAQPN